VTRRPVFWIAFVGLGLAGTITALQLFSVALPNISLDITMDRGAAIADAAALAERYEWGPSDARSAASFGLADSQVQTYVELEGGGRDAFQALTDAGVYEPYQWVVRRFAEDEVEEARVRFSPSGRAYGFRLSLTEDDPGDGNLDEAAAITVAESGVAEWGVDVGSYALIESSDETLPGGRVDHTFVYEHDDLTVADARFRMRVVVAGGVLAQLTHFVHVPEAFSRQYADMRSTNDAIALVSQSIFLLFFVLLGAGVGSALLLRRRWIEWRKPLAWGGAVALLFGLNSANTLPLSWMLYDTALSANTFVFQQIAAAGAIAILGAPVLAFFFMAGESLGRRAFPGHLQQWRLWSPDVAASNTALGLTVAAYVLTGIQLGYVIVFYLGTAQLDGWWSPADALVQPDLLATYMPWLQAVSVAFFASFWEESIFRAVPIACAALIGARYGRKNLWVWGTVILSAVVFAAGHANYPQQPSYARVIELTPPAVMWGSVYVFFGLVPTILAHFLYDLALISTLLFASDAIIDQGVVVLVGLVPLAIVLRARRGGKGRSHAPEWAYNRAWSPPEKAAEPVPVETAVLEAPPVEAADADEAPKAPAVPSAQPDPERPPAFPPWAIYASGLVGLALWVTAMAIRPATPTLDASRTEVVVAARAELSARGIDLEPWTATAFTTAGRAGAHEYVLDQVGLTEVEAISGAYLPNPQWIVRFVNWDAAPEERVEEFQLFLDGGGHVTRFAHRLPEGRAGGQLDEVAARARVSEILRAESMPLDLLEIGAEETTHPSRTDWDFTFLDPSVLAGVDGEARVSVDLAGDDVADVRRFVHVPEEWQREQREGDSRRFLVFGGLAVMLGLAFAAAAIVAIVVWSRGNLQAHVAVKVGAAVFVTLSLSAANSWPASLAVFSTAQPFAFQASGAAIGLLLIGLVAAGAVGLVAALGHSWFEDETRRPAPSGLGVALGLLLAGVGGFASVQAPGLVALPDYSGAATVVPVLVSALDGITPLLFLTSFILTLAAARRRLRGHPIYGTVTGFTIFAVGVVIVPNGLQESLLTWAVSAVAAAVLFRAVIDMCSRAPAMVPILVGAVAVADAIGSALVGAYPQARLGGVLGAVVAMWIAIQWAKALTRPEPVRLTA
jgi:membrane protease YdiL (CAAX protease family)